MTKEILKLVRASSALHAHRRPQRPRPGRLPRSRRPRRPGIRHRVGLFRSVARHRPLARAAGGGRRHRRRLRRRHQRHHAGARAQPRPADGLAARSVARQCRCLGAAGARRAGRELEQVVHQAADLGGGGDRHPAAIKDLEVRQKLSLFVRSRWFKPPLDGPHHGRPDVRRRHLDGCPSAPALRCCRPATASTCSSRSPTITATGSSSRSTIRRSFMSWSIITCCASAIGAGPTARWRAISGWTMRPASPSRRAPHRRFRAPFRRRRSWRWTDLVAQRGATWPRRAEFLAGSSSSTCRPMSTRPRRPSSMARCSTTGRSRSRSRPSMAAPAYRQVDRRLVYIEPHPASPGRAGASRCAGVLLDPARRDVGYPELPAGDRRAELGDRVQRSGAAAAGDHRQRPPAYQRTGHQGRHRELRAADLVAASCAPGASRSIPRSRAMPASPTRPMCGSSSPRCARSAPN